MTAPRESLLDTGPGRLFIKRLRWWHQHRGITPTDFVATLHAKDLIRQASSAVGRLLYSGDRLDVSPLNADYPELCESDAAGLAALSKLSTFDSPQIHQGMVTSLAGALENFELRGLLGGELVGHLPPT